MTKSLLRSFAGGEITPEMFGRLDLTKFQTGLQLALNAITLPHGPAARRPGTYYTLETKTSAKRSRLIPFVFAANQAVMLEFGDMYVRFHSSAGTVLEASKVVVSVAGATIEVTAHGWSAGDWLFVTNAYYIVSAVPDADHVTLTRLDGAVAAPAGTAAARVYTLVSPYAEADLPSIKFAQSNDVLTLMMQGMATRELRRSGATSWAFSTVSFAPTLSAPAADLVTESAASTPGTCVNNLTQFSNYNTISWGAVVGAARYYVYRLRGGVYGYVGQTTTTSLIDDNIAPDTLTTPPESNITLNTGATAYPATGAYHERRRWFAGTSAKPQNVWATRNATESNLTSSIPSRPDDAMEFRIASNQQQSIRHLVPLIDLVALTVGGEFRIFADPGPAISPDTLAIKPQGNSGAADVQPALAVNSVLYVQAQGSFVRELAYDTSGTGAYRSIDVSIMAPHLFLGYTIVELAYSRAPLPVCWAVRSDGVLLGMTYVPDQQVYGWHRHATDGFVESCAVIPESNEDVLYLVVRRTVNGRTVRFIERMTTRNFVTQTEAFFVDAGLTYRGAPVTTLTGLWHLEGRQVQVLADGAVVSGLTVANGSITLPTAASVVHVGLTYTTRIQTLPLAYDGAAAFGQGTMKNVSKVFLRVNQSLLVKAGPSFDKLRDYPARAVSDPYDSPPSLRSGELALSIDPSWNTDGSVCLEQAEPLPLTVAAIALETQTGGG